MLKIKHTQTFSMIVYNEKRTWWTQKNFITHFHCKCNFGVVKMSIRIPQDLDLYPIVD
jgi:protein associated with RNAse G/E